MIGRKKELQQLLEAVKTERGSVMVLYGIEGIGKTSLLMEFMKNEKGAVYYCARECTMAAQLTFLAKEWGREGGAKDYLSLILGQNEDAGCEIVIIDEFHYMAKDESFWGDIMESIEQKNILFILSSSCVGWVENDMIKLIAGLSRKISAIHKLTELGFSDFMDFFPETGTKKAVSVYSIFGGVPAYLSLWNEKKSVKDNITSLILNPKAPLRDEAVRRLKWELRELSFYQTILTFMAGKDLVKLNELYECTGVERAKISVYLKHLMEIDVVEKVFSFGEYGKKYTQKGIYRIKDYFLRFWYACVFPNLSLLEKMGSSAFYDNILEEKIKDYPGAGFSAVCQEYLSVMNEMGRLPFNIVNSGGWYGKEITVDYIGESDDGRLLVAVCFWKDSLIGQKELTDVLEILLQAGIRPEVVYLFAKKGFAAGMEQVTQKNKNYNFISLSQL